MIEIMSDIAYIIEKALSYQREGKLIEAERIYNEVLEIDPNQPDAMHLLGMIACSNQNYERAIELINDAILLNPKEADYHMNLSSAYWGLQQTALAKSHLKIAIQLNPNMSQAHYNLGNVLFAEGSIDQSIMAFKRSLKLDKNNQTIWTNYLFALNFCSKISSKDIFRINRKWAKDLENKVKTQPTFDKHTIHDRRLKIGYFLPEFDNHVTLRFLTPVLAAHDRFKFELFGYGNRVDNKPAASDIDHIFDRWTDVGGFDPAKIAQIMRNDKIDILLHPCTYKSRYRYILAHRAAPIQIACINLVSTTGLKATDYLITDNFISPIISDDRLYTERLIRLTSFNTYKQFIGLNEISPLPAIKNNFITFGSCNNIAKINDDVIDTWSQILKRVKNSRLLLKHRGFDSNDQRNNVSSVFSLAGISADRIVFSGYTSSRRDYLKIYNEIDIALDPFPFGGGTVSYEAIWMGVPVLTIAGSKIMERFSGSLMHQLGLEKWVLKTKDQYISTAEIMANDIISLSKLRQNLRINAQATIFNAKKYTRELEDAIELAWRDYLV